MAAESIATLDELLASSAESVGSYDVPRRRLSARHPHLMQLSVGAVSSAAGWDGSYHDTDGLPPVEARLINPKLEKIMTPVNDYGLIDLDKLINVVNDTIDPEYLWPAVTSCHHMYWPERKYQQLEQIDPSSQAVRFRELSANKVRVPRLFENWLHAITLPPPVPDPEVMHQVTEAWQVSKDFFTSVRETTRTKRLIDRERQIREFNTAQEEILTTGISRKLSGVAMHLEALEYIRPEFWPFEPTIPLQRAAGQVGKVLMNGWQRRTRAVRDRVS